MDKKGEMLWWLAFAIIVLATLIVLLVIVGISGGKFSEFVNWLESIF